jgi:multiple antibiotic resistance protein
MSFRHNAARYEILRITNVSLSAYFVLALSSLFVVVNPIAAVPAFIAMTPRDSVQSRVRMAGLACVVAASVLILFAVSGKWIFEFLGVTLPAFQVAGSLLLLTIALDMLHAKRSAAQETLEETEAGTSKDDIAITPLGVPMLAGPGAISTSLILMSQAQTWAQRTALIAAIALVGLVCYLILRISAHGARWLSPLALKLFTRLMGLLLAAIAVQFAIKGLRETPLFKS